MFHASTNLNLKLFNAIFRKCFQLLCNLNFFAYNTILTIYQCYKRNVTFSPSVNIYVV